MADQRRGGKQGQGRGGGQGRGASPSDSDQNVAHLKGNLQEAIKKAEMLLSELDLEKGTTTQKHGKPKKDTRGSKSMINLTSGSDVKCSRRDTSSRGKDTGRGRGRNTSPRGKDTGRGRAKDTSSRGKNTGRGRGNVNPRAPSHPGGFDTGYSQGRPIDLPPPLFYGDPSQYSRNFSPSSSAPLINHSSPPHYSEYRGGQPQGNIPPYTPARYKHMPPSHEVYGARPPFPHPYGQGVPPPSYEESLEDIQPFVVTEKGERKDESKRQGSSKVQDKTDCAQPELTAEALVKALAVFRGQFENARNIGRHLERDPSAVVKFAKSRKDLFGVLGEGKEAVIEFVPKILLCSNYFTGNGCTSRDTCKKLHICKTFVTGYCASGASCQYGHRWDTNHNKSLLSKYFLDLIDRKTVHEVIKKLYKSNFRLEICKNYNNEQGCRFNESCRRLHICSSYVAGAGKCSTKNCSFNHNLVDKQCNDVIKVWGAPGNWTTREILTQLMSNMGIQKEEKESQSECAETKPEDKSKPVKKKKKDSAPASDSSDSDTESSEDRNKMHQSEGKKKRRHKKEIKGKTCRSTDVSGDVEIPEICVFSVNDKCMNEKNGCKYLHAKSLFHWQVEREGKWYNFRIFQSKVLENSYRDVNKDTVQVPALDKSKLEDFALEMLNILGTASWKADLRTMVMTSGSTSLKIRRVSTQSSVIFSNPKATVFEWYFKDDQGKWIPYGQVDSLGNQHLVSNITSEDIEKQYMSGPFSTMLVCNVHYKYNLDFSKMTQTNLRTNKEREIRRRPARLSYHKKTTAEENPNSALPDNWSPMAPNQIHLLVPLASDSAEYLEVSSRLRLTLPTAYITNIRRLQNPYLWRLLQYKKADLSQRYDENQLNLQKLFHGVCSQDIITVCKENLDWRRTSAVKQDYGQGLYFSNSAAVAKSHCTVDDFGRSHMFMAQVIIGMVVKGDQSMTRPPCNPVMNTLYDTTVDDVMAPTIFVKYDKEEYYPEYVIEFY